MWPTDLLSCDQDFPVMMDCTLKCETNQSLLACVAFVGCFVSLIKVTDSWAGRPSFALWHRRSNYTEIALQQCSAGVLWRTLGCQWCHPAKVLGSAQHRHCEETTNLNHIQIHPREGPCWMEDTCAMNILKVESSALSYLVRWWAVSSPAQYFEEKQYMETSFTNSSDEKTRARHCEISFHSLQRWGCSFPRRNTPLSQSRDVWELDLPVSKAHSCLGIGKGQLCNLTLAALTRLPTVGKLGKLSFLIQKSPQVNLETITGNVTNWLEYSVSSLSDCTLISNISWSCLLSCHAKNFIFVLRFIFIL